MSKADEIMDVLMKVLDQSGQTVENLHLISYEAWNEIKYRMKMALWHKDLDLSFDSDCSEKYGGIRLSGNTDGITEDFWYFYKRHPLYGWQETTIIDPQDIESAKGFYIEDRYGHPVEISMDQFIDLLSNERSGSQHIGIGSCASTIVTKIKIYRDSKDNLMFDKFSEVYD